MEDVHQINGGQLEGGLRRPRAEEERLAFQAAVLAQVNEPVTATDFGSIFTYWNEAAERLFGWRASEVIGRHADDVLRPICPGGADVVERSLRETGAYRGEIILHHRDGTPIRCECSIRAISQMRTAITVMTDVTARRAAQERLAMHAAMLAQANEPILATTPESVVLFWNEAAERLLGWTAEEIVGHHSQEFLHPQCSRGIDAILRAIEAHQAWRGEIVLRKKSGENVTVEASVRSIPALGNCLISVLTDTTARRALEEQLRQSQKMEAIGLLAGGVAHDFNNLLAVILGFGEVAARGLPPGHPVGGQLSEMVSAARRGAELTRKLLAFSRKQIIEAHPIDAAVSVEDFSRLAVRLIGEDVELRIERPAEAAVVRADPMQLEQVLLNLCTNARQAMPEGGTLRLATRMVSFDEAAVNRQPWARVGAFVEIAVSDTGVGMDAVARRRAFEPFFTTKPDGTGLGLATVYGIVQQHDGFVHLESELGRGTTFRVYLPRVQDAVATATASSAKPGEPEPTTASLRGSETILVAEDEPSLRHLVATTLGELGYRVLTASDGREAMRLYEETNGEIALALLDVVMPRLGAREVYERILALRPGARVLFMTGYAPEATRLAQLIEEGRAQVLQKPFTPTALAAKVRGMLGAQRL